jgi:hypothetical protein
MESRGAETVWLEKIGAELIFGSGAATEYLRIGISFLLQGLIHIEERKSQVRWLCFYGEMVCKAWAWLASCVGKGVVKG